MRFFFKHRKALIPGILIFSSFVILTLGPANESLSSVLLSFLSPFQSILTFGQNQLVEFKENFSAPGRKKALQEKINYLRAKITELEEERLENQRLRRLLAFRERISLEELLAESVGAKVIGREPTDWYRIVTIDKGRSEGVRKGMPVITAEGIVGYISEVAGNASRVRLILDGAASVGGLVQRSREKGVVRGKGTKLCEMVHLSSEANIKEGDFIVSSGLGGRYPAGLRIGKVISIKRKGYLQKAKVFPAVDFSRLEEVLVLKRF